jgi:hypothetical protein
MSNFHRDMEKIPIDLAERKRMISWIKNHDVWSHDENIRVPADGFWFSDDPNQEFIHEIHRWSNFNDCVEIDFCFVDPEFNIIDDDDSKNTKFRVRIEAGPYYDMSVHKEYPAPEGGWDNSNKWVPSHDINLDCSADTLEDALLSLAVIVKYHYGDTAEYLEGVVHDPCETNEANDYKSTCVPANDGFCKNCGFHVSE